MTIILNTYHSSRNRWWKNGLGTVCLNWSFKFNSKRLVSDYNASYNLQEIERGIGVGEGIGVGIKCMFSRPLAIFKLFILKISTFQ